LRLSGILTHIKRFFRITPFSWPVVGVLAIIKHEKQKAALRPGSNAYIQYLRAQPWFKVNGDDTLRLDYVLNENSIVFDLGGYKGEFAAAVLNKYNCKVFIFEPIPFLYEIIKNKFSKNKNLHAYCFGLYIKNTQQQISLSDDGSSLFIKDTQAIEIFLKDIVEFINENTIVEIDLIKLNIEGAEYDILETLINNGLITHCKNIQVQFHDFIIPDAKKRMELIQDQLSKTHELTYQYLFVWENWKLKDSK
jgi:FkbM family methyltransferase